MKSSPHPTPKPPIASPLRLVPAPTPRPPMKSPAAFSPAPTPSPPMPIPTRSSPAPTPAPPKLIPVTFSPAPRPRPPMLIPVRLSPAPTPSPAILRPVRFASAATPRSPSWMPRTLPPPGIMPSDRPETTASLLFLRGIHRVKLTPLMRFTRLSLKLKRRPAKSFELPKLMPHFFAGISRLWANRE